MKRRAFCLLSGLAFLALTGVSVAAQSGAWMDETGAVPQGYDGFAAKQNEGEGGSLEFVSTDGFDILPVGSFFAPLDVPVDVTIDSVKVILDIYHPEAWGMSILLVPPQGLPVITLANTPTGVKGGFLTTIFSDKAAASITTSRPPYAGYYRPSMPLSALDGRPSSGMWAVQITDYNAAVPGVLRGWSLILNEPVTEGEGEGESVGEGEGESVGEGEGESAGEGEGESVGEGEGESVGEGEGESVGEGEGESVGEGEGEGGIYVNPLTRSFASLDVPVYVYSHSTVSSTVNVPLDFTIEAMNVTLQMYHGDTHDLTAELESPSGTKIVLFSRPGGPGEGFRNTVLSDSGASSIRSGAPPFSGPFRPEEPLSTFNGQSAQGTWRLTVTDDATYNAGGLTGWQLAFNDAATVTGGDSAKEQLRRWLWPLLGILVPVGIAQFAAADPCFIATAAYGTPLADEVNILRAFRDTFLMSNGAGTAFVDLYYQMSPPLAAIVAVHPELAAVVRLLLMPVVLAAYLMLACPGWPALLILVVCGWWLRRRKTRMG